MSAKMLKKESRDWCHVCGKRKELFTEISYPENAEHGREGSKFVRICSDCLKQALSVTE